MNRNTILKTCLILGILTFTFIAKQGGIVEPATSTQITSGLPTRIIGAINIVSTRSPEHLTPQATNVSDHQTQNELKKDTPDVVAIKESLERALEIKYDASVSLNPEKLAEAFTNDKRFLLSQSGLQTVRELTDNPTLESAGYYDYVHASIAWLRDAILKRQALTEKAKSENRNLTVKERKSLVSNGGRIAPSRIGPREGSIDIKFVSIEIDGDIAKVITVIGATKAEYTLVNYDGKWYVANYHGIMVNP